MPKPPLRSSSDLRSLAPPASQENGYLLLVAREVEELKPRVASHDARIDALEEGHGKMRVAQASLADEQASMMSHVLHIASEQAKQKSDLAQIKQASEASRSASLDAAVAAQANRATQTTRRTSWTQTLVLAVLYLLGMAIKEWIK